MFLPGIILPTIESDQQHITRAIRYGLVPSCPLGDLIPFGRNVV